MIRFFSFNLEIIFTREVFKRLKLHAAMGRLKLLKECIKRSLAPYAQDGNGLHHEKNGPLFTIFPQA